MLTSRRPVFQVSRRTAVLLLLAAAGPLVVLTLFARRATPLFVNLGPGDAPFTHGFRDGWERDGPRGEGETAFHWTEDGAWLRFPVVAHGPVRARLRHARFTRTPAEVTVVGEGRTVATWTQHARGFRLRKLDLGTWNGPVALQFRNVGEDQPLGVALDWIQLEDVRGARPTGDLIARLFLLLVGVPLAIFALTRAPATAAAFGVALSAAGIGAVWIDRLGGLLALANAAVPALLVTAALGALSRAARARFPHLLDHRAVQVAWAGTLAATVALAQPFFYYPDVDTHADLVEALDETPSLALDPRPYQAATGAWTRGIGDARVPFPYSPAFHVLAWPLAHALGAVAAVKTVAVLSFGLTLLLAHALACGVGLPARAALLAQGVVVFLPVSASRLTLALYPALLAQALELGLVVFLSRRLPLASARTAFALLVAVQLAYTGSLLSVAVLVASVVSWEALRRDAGSAVRLAVAWAGAVAAVVAVQYARFLPVLWRDVLPHAGGSGADPSGSAVGAALVRLAIFFDHVHPLLALGGAVLLGTATPARRMLRATLLAGLALLALRYLLPALFRDVKEVELLAAPVAVAMAAAWAWLWTKGRAGRLAVVVSFAWVVLWGAARAHALYTQRFVAVDRWS
jgi:hypothetical protein